MASSKLQLFSLFVPGFPTVTAMRMLVTGSQDTQGVTGGFCQVVLNFLSSGHSKLCLVSLLSE